MFVCPIIYTDHKIVNKFEESGEISVLKGQKWKVNTECSWSSALRQCCIKARSDSVLSIIVWAQQHNLLVAHNLLAIYKYKIKLYHAKNGHMKTYQELWSLLGVKAVFKWTMCRTEVQFLCLKFQCMFHYEYKTGVMRCADQCILFYISHNLPTLQNSGCRLL